MFSKDLNILVNSVRSLKNKFHPDVYNKKFPRYWWDIENFPPYFHKNPYELFDLNSRYLTIVGNPGTQKTKIGKKLADYFNLKYYPDVSELRLFSFDLNRYSIDLRKYNDLLPPRSQIYTRKHLFNDPDPIKNGRPLLLQKYIFLWRYFYTCKALNHVFCKTQGILQKNSPWLDKVMALTLVKNGMMSQIAYEYYDLIRAEMLPYLLKPHIIIYVKSSPGKIRETLKAANRWEADAPNLTDDFLNTYDETFMEVYEKVLKRSTNLYVLDLDNINIDREEDLDEIGERIADLNYDFKLMDAQNPLFSEWRRKIKKKMTYANTKQFYSSAMSCFVTTYRHVRFPYALPEGVYSHEERAFIEKIYLEDIRVKESMDFSYKHNSFLEALIPNIELNYNSMENSPIDLMKLDYTWLWETYN